MLINFSEMKMLNIEGEELSGVTLHKDLANALYQATEDLGMVEHARTIYKGEPVDLSPAELDSLQAVVDYKKNGAYWFTAVARKTMLDFITSHKTK